MRKTLVAAFAFAAGTLLAAPLSAGEKATQERAFLAESTGVILPFNVNRDDVEARCTEVPEGKIAWGIASFTGSGTGTHLGLHSIYAEHCSYGYLITLPDGSLDVDPDGTYGQGRITITAANGDVLLAEYDDGISYPEDGLVVFMDNVTFVDGGTGRFTFASGSASERGTVNFTNFTFTTEISGVIDYSRR
jgi:hypothetical protein